MSDEVVVRIRANLDSFREEMRRQGIHVGVDGVCPVDGQPWPCDHNNSVSDRADGQQEGRE